VNEDEAAYVSMSDQLVEGSSNEESSSYEPVKMVLRKKNAAKQAAVLGISGKLKIEIKLKGFVHLLHFKYPQPIT
jgi:hypothetical protein